MKCTPVSGDTSPSLQRFVDSKIYASALRYTFACPRAPPFRTLSWQDSTPACACGVTRSSFMQQLAGHWLLRHFTHHLRWFLGGVLVLHHRQPRDFREPIRTTGEDEDCHASVLVDLRGDVGRLLALELAVAVWVGPANQNSDWSHEDDAPVSAGGFGGRRGGSSGCFSSAASDSESKIRKSRDPGRLTLAFFAITSRSNSQKPWMFCSFCSPDCALICACFPSASLS